MYRIKLSVAAVILCASIFSSCGSSSISGGKTYVLSDDKSYEASLFRQNCAICHGREGEGQLLENGTRVPSLRDAQHKFNTRAEIFSQITHGGNGMTPFEHQLTDRERQMLTDLVYSRLRGGK